MAWGVEPSYRDRTLRLRCYQCQGLWYQEISWQAPVVGYYGCPVCLTTRRSFVTLMIEWPDPEPGTAVMD